MKAWNNYGIQTHLSKPNSKGRHLTKSKFTTEQINKLESWYSAHRTSEIGPYPSNQEKEILHNKTNLTTEQVGRWLEVKRAKKDNDVIMGF